MLQGLFHILFHGLLFDNGEWVDLSVGHLLTWYVVNGTVHGWCGGNCEALLGQNSGSSRMVCHFTGLSMDVELMEME